MNTISPDPIYQIAQSTAGEIGAGFLAALVKSMHAAMDVSIAFITRGVGEPPARARISYSWNDEGRTLPADYELEGTPCRFVYQGQNVLIPAQLSRDFPKEVGRESYCGTPLKDGAGKVTGHFAVISNAPIQNPDRVEGIMRIFGMRVEAELQRIEREAEREELIARLNRSVQRLARQHQTTRKANEFKSEMLGMVAHDLRNPLAVIVSRAELVASLHAEGGEAAVRKQVQKSCGAIGQAADRMERMIADLLSSARKDATSISLNRAPIDLAGPVRSAIGMNTMAARRKGIRIEDASHDPIQVFADEDRLIEAFDNLLSNAVKFSKRGSAIAVTTGRDDRAGSAYVRIRDEGEGMGAQDLALAFQRFQQLSAKPTGGEASTGLGLAIVKTIVEAHDGEVEAASAGKGLGTTFTVRLPLHALA